MIHIVDYGMGNLGSVLNMFKKIGAEAKISSDLNEISKAEKLLLPGVGAFDAAMERINSAGLKPILDQKALKDKIPVLGICLGMQLLTESSEEGALQGLGWIPGTTCAFKGRVDENLKIPHMGWNISEISSQNQMTSVFEGELRFYYVHSYFVKVRDENHVMMKCTYGLKFDSAIAKDNIFGAQFHPEKSHRFGMQFFKNFASI